MSLGAGVFPPIVTPLHEDERVDIDGLQQNIERWNATGLAGYVVLGSNGEGVHLTADEAEACFECAVTARAPGKLVIAGTGRQSLRETLELTQRAAGCGCDAVLVVPPSYFLGGMTESVVAEYYERVADAAELPVILYHVPKFAPVVFSAGLVQRLSRHENVIGIKDTSGDMMLLARLTRDRSDAFRVYAGSGHQLLYAAAMGADGGIVALAGVAPRLCVRLCEAVRAGDLPAARELHFRLLELNAAVTSRFGVAGLKYALERLGYRAGPPRRPLRAVGEEVAAQLDAILDAAGIRSAEDG